MAIRTPSSRERKSMLSVAALSLSRTVSVISNSRRSGANPEAASALTNVCGSAGLRNWAGERLTAILRSAGHCAAVAQACRMTHSPMGTINPVSSARGMNEAGEIIPFSGCRHRTKASRPQILLLAMLMTG
jgi:hypothetical protein